MNKDQWIQELKVGDTVCDCRFRHVQIREISHVDYQLTYDRQIRYILFFGWLPESWDANKWYLEKVSIPTIDFMLDRVYEPIRTLLIKKGVFCKVFDKELVLVDGACCSARYCCDPVNDHNVEDHPKTKED